MALCVALAQDGTLIPTGQPVGECTGYVLVSSSEHAVYGLINQVFATPTPEQAAGWFSASFGAVVGMFVVARIAGTVANFFK
ncbi:MAG: hypothetical protein DI584_03130 [Stenotrophomonas sp.]|jgi:hypothetical protein|nr:MAG: hypothetical protein DI584_03130 [Stenotrophomonas sp.]